VLLSSSSTEGKESEMHQETSCIKPTKSRVATGMEQLPSTPSLISSIIIKNKLFPYPACHPLDEKNMTEENS